MLSSVFFFYLKMGFLLMPLDEFKLLCSVTSNGTPKKEVCFFHAFSFSFPGRFNKYVCGTVSSMLSGLKSRSLGLNTLGTT